MKLLKLATLASLLAVSPLFGDVAEMIINEIMYMQQGSGKNNNDEFVEFYVTKSGNIKDYVFSDQEGGNNHIFTFPTQNVLEGEYVILHLGTTTGAGNSTSTATGYHFYMNKTRMLNNTGDDVVLLQPSATDTTTISGVVLNAIPFDYVAYGKKTSSQVSNTPPVSNGGVTVDWDYDNGAALKTTQKGTSISLSTNGDDGDTSYCWEITTSGDANNAQCLNYKPTLDTNTNNNNNGTPYVASGTDNNNGMPDMHITKTSIVISDPVNNTTSPKRIPGAIIRYCFTVKNTGDGSADNAAIHDTLNGDNKDKLTHRQSGKATIVTNTNDCTESDCKGIADTSGSYNAGTKKVDIDLTTPFPKDNHQCAYIEMEIK